MSQRSELTLERLDDHRWRIERDQRPDMRTDGIVYSSDTLIDGVRHDASLDQVANVATLPGIVGASMAMPDIHWGYGFPIGGVAAFDAEDGVISPGGVGYDINCGISLGRTNLEAKGIRGKLDSLADALYQGVPCGVGVGGRVKLKEAQVRQVLEKGARWVVERGDADEADLDRMEEYGRMESADPDAPSSRACERGEDQVGTLGSGNHFLEVQVVDEVFDESAARKMGLEEGMVTFMVHSGSRGFGYQVCQEQLKRIGRAPAKYGIELVDRQLACAPVQSEEGRQYAGAMAAAANFAWANRLMLVSRVRHVFEQVFGKGYSGLGMGMVLDITHNMAKFENHMVNGRQRRLCVHRKGATRAFPAGDERIPSPYRDLGQPLLIPGDMGTSSYVLVGAQGSAEQTFGSACHGAGRVQSRRQSLRETKGRDLAKELASRGIRVRSQSKKTLGEEASSAYKDVEAVVDAAAGAGLVTRAVRLKPLAVIKG